MLFEWADADKWLGYTTKKTVYIQDRWLGLIYYSLVACVLLYIFGVQILVHNEQFLLSPVEGIARMIVSHPTRGLCDMTQPDCKSAYRSLQELNYCSAYDGKKPLPHQAACQFEDALTIMPNGEVDNKIFIPTSVEIITEKRSCTPAAENGFTCDNEYEEMPGSDCLNGKNQCKQRGGKTDQFYYVADTKNFQIQFTSSYEQGEVHGTSLDHPAYYEICSTRLREANETHLWNARLQHSESSESKCEGPNVKHVKLPCADGVPCRQRRDFDLLHDTGVKKTMDEAHKVIHGLRPGQKKSTKFMSSQGHLGVFADPSSPEPSERHLNSISGEPIKHDQQDFHEGQSQWTSAYGDVFKLDRLMELAGTDLDKNFNMEGYSTRESGTVLEVSVVYTNLHPFLSTFGYKDVDYYYRVKELPLPYVNRRQLSQQQPPDFPQTRRYEIRHGIMIWFRVVGEFGNFSRTYLLIYLVTAFALIGASTGITDVIAIYVHKRKNNYFNLKYEISADFSDMWQCGKCDYWNSQLHAECQGYAMWENSQEATRCSAPKHDLATIPSGRIRQQ